MPPDLTESRPAAVSWRNARRAATGGAGSLFASPARNLIVGLAYMAVVMTAATIDASSIGVP